MEGDLVKILLVFTGGTIGSQTSGNRIDIIPDHTNILLKLYHQEFPKHSIHFEVIKPLHLLSENMIPADWQVLKEAIDKQLITNSYDGIIITHGTDTLAYTASAMAYGFSHTRIPIVIIGSNYPITNEESDGYINFKGALDFIENNPLPEVVVIFKNSRQEMSVYLGNRITQSLAFKHDFNNFSDINLGILVNGKLQVNKSIYNQLLYSSICENDAGISFNYLFSGEILYIKPYPGLNYDYYSFKYDKPKAIIHDLYHSGTASIRESYSLLEFLKRCKDEDIDFYVTSFEKKDHYYATTYDILKAGAIPVYNMLTEASIVKLKLAYGNFINRDSIVSFVNKQTVAHEHLCKGSG